MLILGFLIFKILSFFKIAFILKIGKLFSGALFFNYHIWFFLEKSLDMLIASFMSFSLLQENRSLISSGILGTIFILFSFLITSAIMIYFCLKKSFKDFTFWIDNIFCDLNPKWKNITLIYFGWFLGLWFLVAINIATNHKY